MKVVIGNKIYDPDDRPIVLVLTDQDKANISNMTEDADCYIIYPDGMSDEDADKIMNKARAMVKGEYEPGIPKFKRMKQMNVIRKGFLEVVSRGDLSVEEIADLKGKTVMVDDEIVKVIGTDLWAESPGTIHLSVQYLENRERNN